MYRTILTIFISLFVFNSQAQLSVAEIFTDHMVIQRGEVVPVWGWTAPGDEITVRFQDETVRASADKEGSWRVELPPFTAGGPHTLHIEGSSEQITLTDILVGDVWLCSGQSNMEWIVANSNNAENEIANSDHPLIRHYKVEHTWSREKEQHLEGGPWEVASPETTGEFSAVGYFFARELQKDVNVPIGLLNSSWGGSRIEPWMRIETVKRYLEDDLDEFFAEKERERKETEARLKSKIGALPDKSEFMAAMTAGYDDSSWETMSLPSLWESKGYNGLDGIAWLRKEFNLSDSEAASDIMLDLAMIDDSDQTYVNGTLVGETINRYNEHRNYSVPADVLKPGLNVILIRVEDTGGGGGLFGDASDLHYTSSGGEHSLAGEWKFRIAEIARIEAGMQPNQTPTVLYNKMIHPIIHFPIKGVLWYQGESNAGNAEDATIYRDQFKDMISDWRELWGIGEFPFLWVQLANFMAVDEKPAESNWAILRESQSSALELPNTAEAVIIDIGEADDIHPRNKQDVGLRLSLAARRIAYGEDVIYSGPVAKDASVNDNKVVLRFDHSGGGLTVAGGGNSVQGFAIAGKDGDFVWAEARIVDDRVEVWSDEISKPARVRYAWGNNPDKANLYNAEGLPARPFRLQVK